MFAYAFTCFGSIGFTDRVVIAESYEEAERLVREDVSRFDSLKNCELLNTITVLMRPGQIRWEKKEKKTYPNDYSTMVNVRTECVGEFAFIGGFFACVKNGQRFAERCRKEELSGRLYAIIYCDDHVVTPL